MENRDGVEDYGEHDQGSDGRGGLRRCGGQGVQDPDRPVAERPKDEGNRSVPVSSDAGRNRGVDDGVVDETAGVEEG